MSHSWFHAVSSAKKHGGAPEDYLPIHEWFDESKAHHGDFRHRALRHHSMGIFWAEEVFGPMITVKGGKWVPVRIIGEQHVIEDLGFIPAATLWLKQIKAEAWMTRSRKLSEELEKGEPGDAGGGVHTEGAVGADRSHDHKAESRA